MRLLSRPLTHYITHYGSLVHFLSTNGPRVNEMALGAFSCVSTKPYVVEQRDSFLLPPRSQARGPPGKPSLGRVSTPLPSRVLPWRNIMG